MDIISDLTLVKLFMKKSIHDSYVSCIRRDLLEMEISILLEDFAAYFKQYGVEEIPLSSFPTWFFHHRHPNIAESKAQIFKNIFKNLETTEIGDDVDGLLRTFQEKSTATALRAELDAGFSYDKLQDILKTHEKLVTVGARDEDLIFNDLDAILKQTDDTSGLRWRLDCLNESIKPLRKGKFIIVSAYVDVGKTMFAVSEAAYMARQLKTGRVLWMNNEEDNSKVYKKIWQSVLGLTETELGLDPEKCKAEYKRRMNGDIQRINIIDIRGKSLDYIKNTIEKYAPVLCIIDQVDKIGNTQHKSFSDHDRLKNLYGEIRDLNNKYCPIIAISQADRSTISIDKDTGEAWYNLYPHHGQLDGSKVGKPGEADAIIMIGRRTEQDNTRGIHVSKNKFGTMIKQEVIFDGARARYLNP